MFVTLPPSKSFRLAKTSPLLSLVVTKKEAFVPIATLIFISV